MALQLVQVKHAGGNPGPTSLSFSSNITNGNLIVVLYQSEGGVPASPSCSDTLGTTYTQFMNSGTPVTLTGFWGIAPLGGANTVSLAGVHTSYNHITIHEFSGSPTWAVTGNVTTGSGTSITGIATGGTNGFSIIYGASFASASTFSWTTPPATAYMSFGGNDAGSMIAQYGNQATYTPTATQSSNTNWSMATIVFTSSNVGFTTAATPNALLNVAYNTTLSAFGGAGSGYTFSLSSGSLPTGLSLSSGGVISGTPTVANTYTFTVQVTDGSTTATQQYTILVASGGGSRPFPCKLDYTNPLTTNLVCLLAFNENPQWYSVNNLALSGDTTNPQSNPMWFRICGYQPVWDNTPSLVFPGGTNGSTGTPGYIDTQGQIAPFESSGLTFASTPWTVVMSIWINNMPSVNSTLMCRNTGSSGWTLYFNNNGSVRYYHTRTSTVMNVVTATGTVTTGQWYQLAWVYDGSQTAAGMKIYVNGVQPAYTLQQTGSGTFATASGVNVNIGGGSDTNACLDGKMAYCAMYWNRQLSAAELNSLDAGLPIVSAAAASTFPTQGYLQRYGWTATVDSVWDSTPNYQGWNVIGQDMVYNGSTNNSNHAASVWASANTAPPHYAIIDMQTAQTFNGVYIQRRLDSGTTDGFPAQADIYVSNDGVTWGSPVYTNNSIPWQSYFLMYFPTQTARYIKLNVRLVYNGGGATGQNDVVLQAIRVMNTDFTPLSFPYVTFTGISRNPQALPDSLYNTLVQTTLAANITSTGYQAITPTSMTGIVAGQNLQLDNEIVWVYQTTGTQFYAEPLYTHSAGAVIKQNVTKFGRPILYPWGVTNLNTGSSVIQTTGPTYMSTVLSSTVPGNNGLQRAYKVPSGGGGGGGGGGTNTSGVGQIFPTGYYF